ncbi:MAG TPA: FxLYD domain-containing protein, partial [Verrucomicrobiae bacterium]|nr:FxLYD domain-containing protein [Verrucomicrobiae bacterium]
PPQKPATPAEPAATESNEVVAQATPKTPSRPKSPDDLKVSAIELEKTKGSSLVYAVGTLTNDSDYDRYGIRVEVDLFNGKGKNIGTAKDYKDYLAPHQDWQFRALIPEPKAVKAQLASVKEDQ